MYKIRLNKNRLPYLPKKESDRTELRLLSTNFATTLVKLVNIQPICVFNQLPSTRVQTKLN